MINSALFWHSQGIATIPLLYRTKKPVVKWKQYKNRLPEIEQLVRWFIGPKRNLAIITTGNLVILDFDNPIEFGYWFCVMIESNPAVVDTHMVTSARGLHLYYWIEDEFEPISTSAFTIEALDLISKGKSIKDLKALKECVPYEIKSHGRLINIPPSVHPSGIPYRAINSPDKIKKISSIGDILTFSPVKFEKPKRQYNNDPWRIYRDGPTERVDLLALFPDARQTDDCGKYFITGCPFHGHSNNFMLNVADGVGYCHSGCGVFLATELKQLLIK